MANKILTINNKSSIREARRRVVALEFSNLTERYFAPLSLREGLLKELRLGRKHARPSETVHCRRCQDQMQLVEAAI